MPYHLVARRQRRAGKGRGSDRPVLHIWAVELGAALAAGIARGVVLMDASYGMRAGIGAQALTYVAAILPKLCRTQDRKRPVLLCFLPVRKPIIESGHHVALNPRAPEGAAEPTVADPQGTLWPMNWSWGGPRFQT
jgi:hypothetical protein